MNEDKKIKFFRVLFRATDELSESKVMFSNLFKDGDVRLRSDEVTSVEEVLNKVARFGGEIAEINEKFRKIIGI